MNRIRGLKKIKSVEEYNRLKDELKAEVDEYVALSIDSNAMNAIKNEFEKVIDSLDKNTPDEEKISILKRANMLEAKYNGLKDGTYLPALKRNITANLIRIEQYEAEMEKVTLGSVIVGLLKNDEQAKNYIRRRFMVSIANRDGVAPAAVDLTLEDPRKIMKYIIESKRYNFVGIKADDLALIPVEQSANPRAVETSIELSARTDEFIKENSNQKTSVNNDKATIKREHKISNERSNHKRSHDKEKDSKEIEWY